MAIEQARKYVEDGYTYVVDIDLSKFFDRVNHDRLMARLTILYETVNIKRFPTVKDFISYGRLAAGTNESGGKDFGGKGRKMGNPYLKWAFMQAAILCKRADPKLNAYSLRLEQKKGKHTANAIVAAKIARAVYFMLDRKTGFCVDQLTRAKR